MGPDPIKKINNLTTFTFMNKNCIILFLSIVFVWFSCTSPDNRLVGSWDNHQGQSLEFYPDGKALWIFYSETSKDTFEISYKTDFSISPHQLDLTDFQTGPLAGRTLYGIIEFQNGESFHIDFEPAEENRPEDFDPDDAQTYYKIE